MRNTRAWFLNVALALSILTAIAAVASGFGARLDIWGFGTGFAILRWSAYVAAGTLVVVLAHFLVALARPAPAGVRRFDIRYAPVVLFCSLVVGVPYAASLQFKRFPTVADATTNIEDPPAFKVLVPVREQTAHNPLAYRRDEAAELQQQYFPDLDSLRTPLPPADVIGYAESVAGHMGLDIAAAEPGAGRLEATATTFWFGFNDDLIVRARSPAEGDTRVDIRSASRVGYLDGGVNAKRVLRFRRLLADKLAGSR